MQRQICHYVQCLHIILMLNDNFFPGIIGLKPENNGYTFWELRNRIIGKILSIIASCLLFSSVTLICQKTKSGFVVEVTQRRDESEEEHEIVSG